MYSKATEQSNNDLTKSKKNENDGEKATTPDDVSPLAKRKKHSQEMNDLKQKNHSA